MLQNNMASTCTGTSIQFFKGQNHFLNNFYRSPIQYDNYVYKTAEHAFQAAKTSDEAEKTKIKLSKTPADAKRLGRRVKLREDWEGVKYGIMEQIVSSKFEQNEELMQKLLRTPDEQLIEYNRHHDNIWGKCVCSRCHCKGTDLLGKILRYVKNKNIRST